MRGIWLALIVWGALAGWSFVVIYATRPHRRTGPTAWWRSPVGWNLLLFTITVSAALTLLTISGVTGRMPWWAWAWIVAVFDVLLTHRLALLIYDDRDERRRVP